MFEVIVSFCSVIGLYCLLLFFFRWYTVNMLMKKLLKPWNKLKERQIDNWQSNVVASCQFYEFLSKLNISFFP